MKLRLISFLLFILTSSCDFWKKPQYNVALMGNLDNNLDPVLRTEVNSRTLLNQLCGRLVKINENLELESFLAKRWTISGDGLVYDFDLNSNFHFPNNRIVSASDVKFSIERMRTIKDSFASSLTRNIEKIEIVNDLKIKLFLKSSNVKFLYLLAHPRFCILSAQKPFINIDGNIFPNSFSDLKVKHWDAEKNILKLFSEGLSADINVFFLDQQKAIEKFNNSEIDDMSFYLLTDDEIQKIKAPKVVIETKYYWTWTFDFNLHSNFSKNISVRRKILQNFNREDFIREWNSNVASSNTMIPNGFLPKTDTSASPNALSQKIFPNCTYKIRIGVITGVPSQKSFESATKNQFKKITGCTPEIIWIPMSDFSKVSADHKYDLYFSAISNRLIDPIEYFRSYISDNSENLLGCSSNKLDAIFKFLEITPVHSRSSADYSKIEDIFRNAACAIPIGNPKFKFIYSEKAISINNNPVGMDMNFWVSNLSGRPSQ